MNDIDILLDQLGEYPATLTGVAGRIRELASAASAFTSTTGRVDSAAAAAGLAEHVGTARRHRYRTRPRRRRGGCDAETLLAVDHESRLRMERLM